MTETKMYAHENAKIREGFEFEGVVYHPWIDYESDGDNQKIFHDVKTPEGKDLGSFDWSPYSTPTAYDFHLWVSLGMPKRTTAGPLTRTDLKIIEQTKGINHG